ncbi:MAG: phosphate transport system substrate-binding protein [Natronomonas sp.]|jgi:phosphate transport system substrate-binding protein
MTENNSEAFRPASRRKFMTAAAASAGALALAGCTESSSNEGDGDGTLSGDINIAGSSTVFPIMSAMSEEFNRDNPDADVNIDISSTGSGGGFANYFCVGDTDFNNASRPIKQEEQDLCSENGVEYVELRIATDALTVVVGEDSFVDELTVEELARIWEEDAAETWDEVADRFPNEPIDRFGAADTSGTYDYFIENIQGSERGHTDDYQATEQDNQIAQGVSGTENAIGYFGFSYYFQNPDGLKPVAIDNGDGAVEPSLETAASGEYQPLSRGLFTYPAMSSLAEEHVAEFARYVIENTTNETLIAENVGYVPATEQSQQEQMDKLEDAIDEAN